MSEVDKDRALREKAIDELANSYLNKEDVIAGLVLKGWSEEKATQFVNETIEALKSPEVRRPLAKKYKRHMIIGAMFLVGGVTLSTYSYYHPMGNVSFVFWGAIIFGFLAALEGFTGWLRNRG